MDVTVSSAPDAAPPPTATSDGAGLYRRLLEGLRDDRRNPARHLHVARFLARLRRWDRALASLRVARALQPRRVETYYLLGFVYRQLGNLSQAAVAYQQLIRLGAEAASAHVGLGSVLELQGRYADAERHFARATELHPASRVAYRHLASIAERLGSPGRALTHLDHLARLQPDDPTVHSAVGRIHHQAGRPDLAVSALRRCLEIDGRNLAARVELMELLLEEEEPAGAAALADEARTMGIQDVRVLVLEGRAHHARGHRDRALAALIAATRKDPADHRPHLWLGRIYGTTGDPDLAEDELNQALTAAPREPAVYRALGDLHARTGAASAADAIFVRMTEAFPDSPEPWRLLGESRERFGDFDGAVAALSRAIELAPADAQLHCARARAQVKSGAYDAAVADFQRARDLDPDCPEAQAETDLIRSHQAFQEALGILAKAEEARAAGEFVGARRHYEHILTLVPSNRRWLSEHANAACLTGAYDDAVASLEKLVALEDEGVTARLRLGRLLTGLHRFDEAWHHVERAVAAEPLNLDARIRLIRIQGHRLLAGELSPDRFPRIEAAYRDGLADGARAPAANLELGWLFLCVGSQIFPVEEWSTRALFHFQRVGERSSGELLRLRLLGEHLTARRLDRDEDAVTSLVRLVDRFPTQEGYAVALLEHLKALGLTARAFRLAEGLVGRFPDHGLLRALDLEFFAQVAATQGDPRVLCRKRVAELQQRVAAEGESASAYLDLALGLIILSPASERFESGRKVAVTLNRAKALAPGSPWPLWAMLREALRTPEGGGPTGGQALAVCRTGLRQFPEFSPFLEHLGRTGLASSDPVEVDAGRALLQRAVVVDEDCTGALFALARHYETLGDARTARHHYVAVLSSPRSAFHGRKSLERLSRLVC